MLLRAGSKYAYPMVGLQWLGSVECSVSYTMAAKLTVSVFL